MPLQAFLGCIRRFQLRARLGRPWQHRISPLTDLSFARTTAPDPSVDSAIDCAPR